MLKKNFCMFLVLIFVIMTNPRTNLIAEGSENDEYDNLRIKWREMLIGGDAYNTSDIDITNMIIKITNDAQNCWDSMDKTTGRTYLWSDLASSSNSANITATYNRLKSMTLALVITGPDFYDDPTLESDIISGLDWLYANWYNENKSASGNWWDWEIGVPLALNDITLLLYDQLTNEQKTNYMTAVDKFQPTISQSGANRMWECIIVAVRGVIVKDASKLNAARNGLGLLFNYVTSDDGFYMDGSFIQHGSFSYNGGYGKALLSDMSKILYLFDDSTWVVTDQKVENVYQWVYDSFEPFLYEGAFMDMTRGREISRYSAQDHVIGSNVIRTIARFARVAPEADASRLKSIVKYMVLSDDFKNVFSDSDIQSIDYIKNWILNDPDVSSREPLVEYQQFAEMDKAVMLRENFAFGLSMFSSRIANYESINGENKKGWHTGSGMTCLYNADQDQYSLDFWPTVNSYRLPGTTVLKNSTETTGSKSSKNWVGGVVLDELYGVSGMEFVQPGKTLSANKSWFMFDDEIVSLGAGITSSDGISVETIVENRKIAGDNSLVVNGVSKPTTLGWSETMTGVNWAHLEGNNSIGADIGYYFPDSVTLYGLREARTANWSSINSNSTFVDSTNYTRNYLTMWMDHGVNPENGLYSYVLLPNKTSAQVQSYSNLPDILILENSTSVQAVKENTVNIIGANFWTDTPESLTVDGVADYITSDKKAAVMVRESNGELEISVSDPTQTNAGTITVEVKKSFTSVVASDPGVNIDIFDKSRTRITVNVAGSNGKSFKAIVSTNQNSALFEDDFEDGDASDWTVSGGAWSVVNDGSLVYKQSNQTGLFTSNNGSSSWDDYKIEAEINIISHTVNGSVGIYARYTDDNNRYAFIYNKNTNKLAISKKVSGTITDLALKTISLNVGTVYKFEGRLNGTSLEFYLNGELQLSATDSEFTTGKIGVGTYNAVVEFDNILVTDLNQGPEVLLEDAFEDGNASDWTASGGTWSVVNDGSFVYKQSNQAGLFTSNNGSSSWDDYKIEANIKIISHGANGTAGIYARYADDNNRYAFTYNKNTNKLAVSKKVNGIITELATKTITLNIGTVYKFEGRLNGTLLEFYLNGELQLSATDSEFSTGKIGVGTYNAVVEFDNILVAK